MLERVVAVVPAYRAEATVGDVVRRVRPLVERVVVVDDGSSDGTAEAARAAGAEVLVHPQNQGKGAALCTAFAHVAGTGVDAVVTLDADGQHVPEEIEKLVDVEHAAIVLGVRAHLFAEMGATRRASNRVSSWLISRVAGVDVADVQTGFRLYRRPVFEGSLMRPGRFESESAVIVAAARAGWKIATVPVEMAQVDGRGTSHYRGIVDSLRIARAVARARWG